MYGALPTITRIDRRGFTLIELLIVVVIIGILAAIAIPRFENTKARAYIGTMKSDLRNLATAQESYSYDNNTYYNGPVPNIGSLALVPSSGVTILLSSVSAGGWAATATHVNVTGRTCALFYGNAVAPLPGMTEGQIVCN